MSNTVTLIVTTDKDNGELASVISTASYGQFIANITYACPLDLLPEMIGQAVEAGYIVSVEVNQYLNVIIKDMFIAFKPNGTRAIDNPMGPMLKVLGILMVRFKADDSTLSAFSAIGGRIPVEELIYRDE